MIINFFKEKKILFFGMAIVLIAAGVNFILLPLFQHFNVLRNSVIHQQELVLWMEKAQKTLHDNPQKEIHRSKASNEPLISVIEKTMALAFLKPTQINKTTDHIAIEFNQIEYAILITWLIELQEQYPVEMNTFQIHRTDQEGMVKATLSFM